MSELSANRGKRLARLSELSELILKTGNTRGFIKENREFIASVVPCNFIFMFDKLIGRGTQLKNLSVLPIRF